VARWEVLETGAKRNEFSYAGLPGEIFSVLSVIVRICSGNCKVVVVVVVVVVVYPERYSQTSHSPSSFVDVTSSTSSTS